VVEKRVDKGKQRAEEKEVGGTIYVAGAFQKVENAGRCSLCVKDGVPCNAPVAAVASYRRRLDAGEKLKSLVGVTCKGCRDRKKRCELPMVEELRRRMEREESAAPSVVPSAVPSIVPSATSSSKRKGAVLRETEMPPPKKTRQVGLGAMEQAALLGLVETEHGALLKEIAAGQREVIAGQREQTVLLTAILAALLNRGEAPATPVASGSGTRKEEESEVDTSEDEMSEDVAEVGREVEIEDGDEEMSAVSEESGKGSDGEEGTSEE
jgi:hypothetical protein